MRSLDLPDESDEPRRAERSGARGPDRTTPKPRELPDPDERGRAYEAMLAHFSAETADGASPGRRPDGTGQRSYRDEMPRYLDTWADHGTRWPPRPRAAVDRPADPPGSADAIGRVNEAEPTCSADAQAIEQENKEKYGGWLAGFEHRLKGEDRLREKIAAKLEVEPNKTPTQALREVADAIRYTYCFQPETYTRGYYDIKERFESCSYEMYYSQNWWTNPEYKGIKTRWVTSERRRRPPSAVHRVHARVPHGRQQAHGR